MINPNASRLRNTVILWDGLGPLRGPTHYATDLEALRFLLPEVTRVVEAALWYKAGTVAYQALVDALDALLPGFTS